MGSPYRRTARTIVRPAKAPWPPTFHSTPAIVAALRAIERSDQDLGRFEADQAAARRLLEQALTRNAFGTASIEGNPLSLEEVESLLERDPGAAPPETPDEREILNYVDFVRDLPSLRVPRSVPDLNRLHARLFQGVLSARGRPKQRENFIGNHATREIVYVPTSAAETPRELEAALAWLHGAAEHPLIKASIFFHEFQSIHPFPDGNGRLGRALTTLILWEAGYHGVRFALVDFGFNQDRDNYYGALSAGRRDGWDRTPWVEYMLGVLQEAFHEAVARFLFQEGLPKNLNDRQQTIAEWAARQDRANRGRRFKLNDAHAAFPAVPRRTLQMDLAILVRAAVLEREGDRKAARYRVAVRPV